MKTALSAFAILAVAVSTLAVPTSADATASKIDTRALFDQLQRNGR